MEATSIPHIDLMICTPGSNLMASYVKSLLALITELGKRKISFGFANGYSSHVADAREVTLSGTRINSLKDSRPFQGEVTYNKLMWIDSDIAFEPEDVIKLYESDKDIICGGYILATGEVAVYPKLGKSAYSLQEISRLEDITEVEGAGFGFICVKPGVFESLERPWFQSTEITITIDDENYSFHMIGEDLSFCARVKEKGYKIYFDPSVKVTHHKTVKLTWKGIMANE